MDAPRVAKEWHPTKNGKLTPRDVVFGSARVVWWKCPEGRDHEWRVAVVQLYKALGGGWDPVTDTLAVPPPGRPTRQR